MKRCKRCFVDKRVGEFRGVYGNIDGRASMCKVCEKESRELGEKSPVRSRKALRIGGW